MARMRGEPLVVLLLDFEKANDRVDLAFLEDTMLCMDFLATWMRGVASLYKSSEVRY